MNMAGMERTPVLEQVAGGRRSMSMSMSMSVIDLPADAQAEKQLRAVGTGRFPSLAGLHTCVFSGTAYNFNNPANHK